MFLFQAHQMEAPFTHGGVKKSCPVGAQLVLSGSIFIIHYSKALRLNILCH